MQIFVSKMREIRQLRACLYQRIEFCRVLWKFRRFWVGDMCGRREIRRCVSLFKTISNQPPGCLRTGLQQFDRFVLFSLFICLSSDLTNLASRQPILISSVPPTLSLFRPSPPYHIQSSITLTIHTITSSTFDHSSTWLSGPPKTSFNSYSTSSARMRLSTLITTTWLRQWVLTTPWNQSGEVSSSFSPEILLMLRVDKLLRRLRRMLLLLLEPRMAFQLRRKVLLVLLQSARVKRSAMVGKMMRSSTRRALRRRKRLRSSLRQRMKRKNNQLLHDRILVRLVHLWFMTMPTNKDE